MTERAGRCDRDGKETERGQNTIRGGSDPIVPQNRGPIPSGFGGHSRLLLLESAARVLSAQKKGIRNFVRQDVKQNRRGGTEGTHGNHQGTTQATKISDDPGASRGVRERTPRPVCEVH